MAAILASIVVAATTRSPAAILGGQGLLASQQLRFSRLYETEADREGFVTLENLDMTQAKWQKCLRICKN